MAQYSVYLDRIVFYAQARYRETVEFTIRPISINAHIMKSIKWLCSVFFGMALLFGCKEESKKIIDTEPVVFTKEGTLTIYRTETDSILANLDIEIADNEYETQTGLMYRESMGDHQGMLFIFPDERMHSFYMKNTEFPLDILFVRSDMKVATLREDAQPLNEESLSSNVPVQYVLEVNAGLAKKWGLQVGDSIVFSK